MKRIIFIFLVINLYSKVFGQTLYVSPGLQIGVNSDFKFFFSGQFTLGIFNPQASPLNPGITIGLKKIKRDILWVTYKYCDFQIHNMGNIIQPGFGLGFIQGKDRPIALRFKFWAGWWILGTYEYINFKNNSKNHIGIFGVLPWVTSIGETIPPLSL